MSVNYASSSQWRANASNEIMWPRCQHDGAKRQGTPVAEDLLVSCVVRIAAFCDNARQNCLGDKGRKAAAFVANAVSIAQGRHTVADPESVADKVGNQRRLLSPDEQQEAMASFVREACAHALNLLEAADTKGHKAKAAARAKQLMLNVEGKFAPAFGCVNKLRLASSWWQWLGQLCLDRTPQINLLMNSTQRMRTGS